ncbi:hypothetical protein COLO4_13420 [Corchorus olitorius]|uniref:Uncharacterized protein n=1 Tax=Corchorus olitorius TaxID=93759 RepID=A0A1R3JWW3_9ROSI|nr:hypothetical protein COLO4_13420 [Corchorus olitorius]
MAELETRYRAQPNLTDVGLHSSNGDIASSPQILRLNGGRSRKGPVYPIIILSNPVPFNRTRGTGCASRGDTDVPLKSIHLNPGRTRYPHG